MRRDFIFVIIAFLITCMFFVNETTKITYNLNILEYLEMSRDYTSSERETLKSYGTLIYGGNITEPPLGKYYDDTEQYLGLVTDLIYSLAIELGTDIVVRPMVWNEALESLKTGEIDLCDLTPSNKRSSYYLFSDQVYDLNGAILIDSERKDIKNIADLNGLKVGVQRGDYVVESLSSQGISPNYTYTDNLTNSIELLYNGNLDAVIGDEPVIKYHLNDARYLNKYIILPEKVYESYVVLGMPKENSDLLPIINKAIFRMKKSGILYKIQGKWLGNDSLKSEKRAEEIFRIKFAALLLVFAVIIYFIYAWNRNLKILIDDRTSMLKATTDQLETILDNIKSTIVLTDEFGYIKKINGDIPGWKSKIKLFGAINLNIRDIPFLNKISSDYSRIPSDIDIKYVNSIYKCHITPINSKIPMILYIITDETVERIQKAKITQSNKMEAVGRLAAGIAHELRNPMGIVRNSTHILKDSEIQSDDDLIAIEAIERSVERAGNIIENLLNYSRIGETANSMINLTDIITEIVRFYKKSNISKNIDFDIVAPHDFTFYSNENSIRHILTNLIGNSMDSIKNEGKILISVNLTDNDIIIDITDNGDGIPKKNIENIFDPFFTSKPIGKGTGLGLYIVYSEVEKLKGSIQVKSQLNKGSTFSVAIPRDEVKKC